MYLYLNRQWVGLSSVLMTYLDHFHLFVCILLFVGLIHEELSCQPRVTVTSCFDFKVIREVVFSSGVFT